MKRIACVLAACTHAAVPAAASADPDRIALDANATGPDLFAALRARVGSGQECYLVIGSAAPLQDFTITAGTTQLTGDWTCDRKVIAEAIRGRPLGLQLWLIDGARVDSYGPFGGVRIGRPLGSLVGVDVAASEVVARLRMSGSDLSVIVVGNGTTSESPPSCDHAERDKGVVIRALQAARPSFARCVQGNHGLVTIDATIAADGTTSAAIRESDLDPTTQQCVLAAAQALAFPAADACPTPFTLPIVIP